MIGFYIRLGLVVIISITITVKAIISYIRYDLSEYMYWDEENLKMVSYKEVKQRRLKR